MPFIVSGGCRLNVQVEGPDDAPAVMLSHYLGGNLDGFAGQLPALAGRRVVRFDTRGQGASDAPDADYSIELLGRDALTILDALNIERADFIGVSQGGMTGMWLAAHHPQRIGRLVLANTTAFIPNKPVWNDLAARARVEGMGGIARATIESWLSETFRAADPQATDRLVATMAAMPVSGYVGNTCVLRDVDLRSVLGEIAAPTLVIGGAEDGPRGASVPILTSGVRNGRSVILSHAAHLSHIENTADFNAAVAGHLSSDDPQLL